jgi:phosphatidylinositol alpha-mannosyltransferase
MQNPRKSKKLSIGLLYDDTLDSNDGVAQYVKTLGAWLSSQGHDVTYLVGETKTPEWAGGRVVSLSKNIKVTFNGNRLSMPLVSSKQAIRRALAGAELDVLHVQVPYSPLMAARVINAAATNTAVVGTFHIFPSGWLSRWGGRVLALWLRRNFNKLDKLVSVSRAAAEFAQESFNLKSDVLPNTVNLANFHSDLKPEPNKIVFLGRLVERKGCLELIKAFKLLHAELPETNLVIGGDGPRRAELQKYVAENGLEGAVKFEGFVAEPAKSDFLAGAAIACFPSLYGESFGIVLIEAMAAGSGVVLGGDNPGYRSVLEGREELLVNPRDTQQLAARLKLLLADKKLAKSLHDWQTETVRQYDVNSVGRRLLGLYREAIAIKNKNEHNNR